MTVLGSLLRSAEDPTLPLTSAALVDWLTGGKSAGVSVHERRVYGLPAYFRAVALTAGTLAQVPLHVYGNGTRERVLQRTVLDAPNPRQTAVEYRVTMYSNAITWGSCYARKLRDGAGIVRQTWPLHPSRVRIEEVDPAPANPEGKLFLVLDQHGAERRYTSYEIFHLPYLSWDGVRGVRPLELFRQSLGIAISGDDTFAETLANGSRIDGVLTTEQKLDDASAAALKKRWKEKTAGPRKAGEVAVLDKGLKFERIALPPADMQLLESRKWSVDEIARMVGPPPHLVGQVEKSTSWGTGIEEQVLGWVKFTLGLWLTLAEQRSTAELLPGGFDGGAWYAKHKLEGLLRGDSKARAAFYHQMITDGVMNRAEVRDREDLEPGPDSLNEFLVPSNLTLVSVDGQLVPLASQGVADAGSNADA